MPDERAVQHSEREPTAGKAAPAPRAITQLNDAECRQLLARQRLCIVSMVDAAEPYAVPVFYGYDGEDLYLGVAEGRKTRVLDANPRVYIVVTEVGPGDVWRSVSVAGAARTLADPDERRQAVDVLIAHNRRVREASSEQPAPRRPGSGRA